MALPGRPEQKPFQAFGASPSTLGASLPSVAEASLAPTVNSEAPPAPLTPADTGEAAPPPPPMPGPGGGIGQLPNTEMMRGGVAPSLPTSPGGMPAGVPAPPMGGSGAGGAGAGPLDAEALRKLLLMLQGGAAPTSVGAAMAPPPGGVV